jgi:glycosyltransferase involved in cell wall biosynthesis
MGGAVGRTVAGCLPDTTIDELVKDLGTPDLYLYVEPLGLIPRGLETTTVHTACILCDLHRSVRPRQTLARLFDHVAVYQKNYLHCFSDHHPQTVHWFPYACDTEVVDDLRRERIFDVGFVGQLFGVKSERRRLLDAIARKYVTHEQRYFRQDELPTIYSRAKIVINLPVGDDLNFRFFEALSCGAMLLTRRMDNGQDQLFAEEQHYAAFSDEGELFEKIDYYLRHQDERLRIARAGYEEVRARHTLSLRLDELLRRIQEGPAYSAPVRGMTAREASSLYAEVYQRAGSVDTLLRLAAETRDLGSRARLLARGAVAYSRRAIRGW